MGTGVLKHSIWVLEFFCFKFQVFAKCTVNCVYKVLSWGIGLYKDTIEPRVAQSNIKDNYVVQLLPPTGVDQLLLFFIYVTAHFTTVCVLQRCYSLP